MYLIVQSYSSQLNKRVLISPVGRDDRIPETLPGWLGRAIEPTESEEILDIRLVGTQVFIRIPVEGADIARRAGQEYRIVRHLSLECLVNVIWVKCQVIIREGRSGSRTVRGSAVFGDPDFLTASSMGQQDDFDAKHLLPGIPACIIAWQHRI